MNRVMLRSIIVFSLVFLAPIGILAEENINIRVAMDHWPPWKIIDGQEFKGIDIDLLHEIENRTNFRFVFVKCPWRRCIQMVKDGDVDMITSFTRTKLREAFATYIEPAYFVDSVVFYSRKNFEMPVSNYNDLYGKKIGVVKGAAYFPAFDNDKKLDKVSVSGDYQLFKMLLNNRIDLYAVYEIPGDYMTMRYGFKEKISKVDFRIKNVGFNHLAISNKSAHRQKMLQLDDVVGKMRAEMHIEKIIEQKYK